MATPTPITTDLTGPDLAQTGWSGLSGRILSGGFELQEMVEADASRARFKVRVLGDRDLDCEALAFRVEGPAAEQQVELWTLARQLRHPNISAPLGAGQIDGWPAIYCVARRADESLDAVLGERALTVVETGETLESVAAALATLHWNGMVFGCLSPLRILAVSESIKVPAECIRATGAMPAAAVFTPAYLAPEAAGAEGRENTTPATDVWCLGATLFEALTQKVWTEGLQEEAGELPEPFASIVLRCVHEDPENRASLAEVMVLYRGEQKLLPRARVPVKQEPLDRSATSLSPSGDLQTAAPLRPAPVSETEAVDTTQVGVAELAPGAGFPGMEQLASSPVREENACEQDVRDENAREQEWNAIESLPLAPPLHSYGLEADPSSGEKVGRGEDFGNGNAQPAFSHRSGLDDALDKRTVRRRTALEDDEEPATSLWVWAGILLLIVLGIIWILRPKAAAVPPAPVVVATAPKPVPNAAAGPAVTKALGGGSNAWQTQTLQPDGSVIKPAEGGGKNGASGVPGAAAWRVISFTYLQREEAQKKAQTVNAKHGNLHAAVFSPSGSGGPYLVVLGNRMTREDAAQFRRKAVSQGMPRDSYIQNYSH